MVSIDNPGGPDAKCLSALMPAAAAAAAVVMGGWCHMAHASPLSGVRSKAMDALVSISLHPAISLSSCYAA